MSVIRCNRCETYIDTDYKDTYEDPRDEDQQVCENCFADLCEEHESKLELINEE